MLNRFFIFSLFTIITSHVFAMKFNEYVNESVYGKKDGFFENLNLVTGIGSQANSLYLDNKSVESTNRNFINLGFSINRYSQFSLNLPLNDPKTSQEARVSTNNQFYSLGSQWTNHFSTQLFYTRTHGFYFSNNSLEESTSPIIKLNNLEGKNTSAYLFYKTDEDATSVLTNPLVLKNEKDSSFPIFWVSLNQAAISGLDDFNKMKTFENLNFNLTTVKSNYFTAGAGYNWNWFWSHWYIRTNLGYGISPSITEVTYSNQSSKTISKSFSAVTIGAAAGYTGKTFASGFYITSYQTAFAIDQYDVSMSQQKLLLYYSYFF